MNVYVIDNPRFNGSSYAFGEEPESAKMGPSMRCAVCGNSLTLMKWLPPYEIKISSGKLGDLIFGTFSNFLVSARFKKLFEEEGLSGIQSFQPVTISYQGKVVEIDYFFPDIRMSNAHIDLRESGFIFEGDRECSGCQIAGRLIIKWDRVVFENPEETEFDVFNTKVLGEIAFASERFREFVSSHHFLNIDLVSASSFSTNWSAS